MRRKDKGSATYNALRKSDTSGRVVPWPSSKKITNNKNRQNNPKIYLEDVLLKDLDNSTHFLGNTFDKNLNWYKQIEMLSSK